MVGPLMLDFHASLAEIGFLSSSFFYTYVILQIPAGILVDRFGARALLAGGCLLTSMAAIIFGCVHEFDDAVAMRLLMGLASSPGVVGVMYLAGRWFPREKFVLLAALVETIGMLGGAVGETSLASLVAHVGWRMGMVMVGLGGIVLALVLLIIIRNEPKTPIHKPCNKAPTKELCCRFVKALTHKAVWVGCLYGAFSFSIIGGFGGLWAIPFLQQVYNYSITQSAWISSMIFIGAAIGAGGSGLLACGKINIKCLMIFASLIAVICLSIILFLSCAFWINAALFLMLGISTGCYVLAFAYVKLNTCETICASAMGLTNMMCLLLGAPILQPLVGQLLAYLNSLAKPSIMVYRLGMLPFLIALGFALITALFIQKPEECKDVN